MIGALPDELVRNVVGAWGDDGARWLAELPAIVQQLAQVWDLAIGAPFELSYHYVAAVTCADGTPAVLKLGVPDGGSLAREAPALAAFDGEGAVRSVEDWVPGASSPVSRALDVAQALWPELA